jgi:AAA ATPase domain
VRRRRPPRAAQAWDPSISPVKRRNCAGACSAIHDVPHSLGSSPASGGSRNQDPYPEAATNRHSFRNVQGSCSALISRMQMTNYKGFERFSLRLANQASILVGPNNAGKSTAIGALRLGAQLIAHAKLRKPEFVRMDTVRNRSIHAYRLASAASTFIDENVAYEFRDLEARVEIHFRSC